MSFRKYSSSLIVHVIGVSAGWVMRKKRRFKNNKGQSFCKCKVINRFKKFITSSTKKYKVKPSNLIL